jgi:hypothetical protein
MSSIITTPTRSARVSTGATSLNPARRTARQDTCQGRRIDGLREVRIEAVNRTDFLGGPIP